MWESFKGTKALIEKKEAFDGGGDWERESNEGYGRVVSKTRLRGDWVNVIGMDLGDMRAMTLLSFDYYNFLNLKIYHNFHPSKAWQVIIIVISLFMCSFSVLGGAAKLFQRINNLVN